MSTDRSGGCHELNLGGIRGQAAFLDLKHRWICSQIPKLYFGKFSWTNDPSLYTEAGGKAPCRFGSPSHGR